MRTLDVRVLIRGSHDPESALTQLLTGALRVHAVVELVALPSGLVVPLEPVVRRPVSETAWDSVRYWDGRPLDAGLDAHGRPARARRDLTAVRAPVACPGTPHRGHTRAADKCPLEGE